ncbi:hypothetical protein ASF82_04195 [Frigoribacterium sp. Leaf164]|uniref:hypothetical protein n=1 Tax=Frigoribacterium sp. Leaf164 TaxID=1736282 RepID=UPI0006F963DF|nr:hypothetical protein [Frigoribacterium sp. Leaf164]KQR46649.1 hypothetical protein ASF82_04195 [Frigoribacterium sp. Leaf164]
MHLSARSTRLAAFAALPLAVVISGVVVGTSSYAAFSDTTENAGNSWATGKVAISDDDEGQALFEVAGLLPGDTGSNCLTVTADTSAASTVRLYASDTVDLDALGSSLAVVVERGAPEATCERFVPGGDILFAGTLADLATSTSFADGVGDWSVPAGTTDSLWRVTYHLADDATNALQEAEAATTFVWEAQND